MMPDMIVKEKEIHQDKSDSKNAVGVNAPKIGFIGQGWIGKHLADNFDVRGFHIVRYAKEEPYIKNAADLATCDIVFIAVPTPTTPEGFDPKMLESALDHVGEGKTAVIKSTILPGTTDRLAKKYSHIALFHSPEFLREASVENDIANPDRNIIGIPMERLQDQDWRKKADEVLAVLPNAPYNIVCSAAEAELTKYGGNNFLYVKTVFMNLLYDLSQHYGADWDTIAKNMMADPRIGVSHMQPVHQIKHMDGGKPGRGAGGHCFIKDFAAFREEYERSVPNDREGAALLRAFESKNNRLLRDSGKDLDLLDGVYGKEG